MCAVCNAHKDIREDVRIRLRSSQLLSFKFIFFKVKIFFLRFAAHRGQGFLNFIHTVLQ